MPIAIIGAGRSGTSMLARMLGLCGLSLGRQAEMKPPDQYNPAGYWEHQSVFDLNQRLIVRLGGTFEDPPDLQPGWEDDSSLTDLFDEAKALIASEFRGRDWVWKLPQATHTIPFWRRVVPDIKYVICLRNPIGFATSVESFPQYARETGIAMAPYPRRHALNLWALHNVSAFRSTSPAERFVTSYEEYFPDFARGLNPVLEFAGLPPVDAGSEVGRRIAEFHDPQLRHHDASVADLLGDPDIPFVVKELYIEIVSGPRNAPDLPILHYADMFLPWLRQAVESESSRAVYETASGVLEELTKKTARLEAVEHRKAHLEAILASRTHRVAAGVCDLLLALRGRRRRTPEKPEPGGRKPG